MQPNVPNPATPISFLDVAKFVDRFKREPKLPIRVTTYMVRGPSIIVAIFSASMAHWTATAATMTVVATKVNDCKVPDQPSVTILPGDSIECDAYLADWRNDLEGLDYYELDVDSIGLVGEESGVLRPIYYTGQIPLYNLCETDAECVSPAYCEPFPQLGLCRPAPCPPSGCPPGQFCGQSGRCSQINPAPDIGSPEIGVYVDVDRPDYVFRGLSPLAIADISLSPNTRLGGGALVS